MAKDSIFFTLEGMHDMYKTAKTYTDNYSAAITELDEIIKALSEFWTSTETHTYDSFVQLFQEKKSKLFEARDYMNRFCSKILEKANDFEEGDKAIIRSFN